MINLFITPKNTLSFEINRANILNEGFAISDEVVLMGGTELDVAKLFKGAKQSLQKKELALQAIKKKTQKEIKKLLSGIKKAKTLFETQRAENKKLEDNILENSRLNLNIKEKLTEMTLVIDEKNKYISQRKGALVNLNHKILDKEKELNELSKVTASQSEKITYQEDTIDTQQNLLQIMLIALGLFLLLVSTIFLMLRRQHKISATLETTLAQLQDTQDELVESAKMASLGELVSGLAHEMNTPIGISITGVSVLQNENSGIKQKLEMNKLKESDLIKHIKTSDEITASLNISLQRAAQLVRSFKQVSVDQQVEVLREFNLQEYLSTILVSSNSQFKHTDIKVNLDVDSSIVLNSYPGIYYQIITNLMNNSLLHGFEANKEGDIWITAKLDENALHLEYKDSGKGVSKHNIANIFDPFFTTKRANGGTGLGLHIIYNLITQKLHGSINAKSVEGEGLTLNMKFPLVLNNKV